MSNLVGTARKSATYLSCLIPYEVCCLIEKTLMHVLYALRPRLRKSGFSARLLRFLCCYPHILKQVWRLLGRAYLSPSPCISHSCLLRRYDDPAPSPPPASWYTYLKPVEDLSNTMISRKAIQQVPDASAFLRLPLEIRNMVYLYAGDATKYQLDDNNIVAYHGSRPSKNLLLICKDVHHEVLAQFFSITTFEVHPLTPNVTSWTPNHHIGALFSYDTLAQSAYVPLIRKMRVRIDVSRFIQGRKFQRSPHWRGYSEICTFDETDLEHCTAILYMRARELCKVLRVSAQNLKVVEIDWVDDYPEQVGTCDLELRSEVLEPFADLEGMQIRVRKLVIAEKGRIEVLNMVKWMLEVPTGN